MKNIFSITKVLALCAAVVTTMSVSSCINDESNSQLTEIENQYGKNTIIVLENDTVRAKAEGLSAETYRSTYSKGDTINFRTLVKYAYPENLKYTWMIVPYVNGHAQTHLVGNKEVYYTPDTIAHTKDLDYIVDLPANNYQIYLVAEDTISGLSASMPFSKSYQGFSVAAEGIKSGLYLLTETADGNTDIEVFTSELMLIYGGLTQSLKYYSTINLGPMSGKPRFIRAASEGKTSKNAFMVATDKNMYRLNNVGLVTMSEWNNMFYQTPATYNPQNFFFTNSCEFLINDGKLYTMYADKANSLKFSAEIGGDKNDYVASPFLMFNTKTSWGAVDGAINADQVLYDKKNMRFIPYFSRKNTMSSFSSTSGTAYLDANKLPAQPQAILNGANNSTYCIVPMNGSTYLLRYNFYNRVDEGDLSQGGERSTMDIGFCTDIANAKYYASCTAGDAFYYSSGKNVYSFAPSSGKLKSETVYTCEAGEEVTCLFAWGSVGGGWPTSSVILWIATWNESTKTSKLIQYEVDHSIGLPNSMWGPMFGAPDNPVITTGWQKIVDMTCLDAQ